MHVAILHDVQWQLVWVSYPAAAKLARAINVCLDQYSRFYGSDKGVQTCLSDGGLVSPSWDSCSLQHVINFVSIKHTLCWPSSIRASTPILDTSFPIATTSWPGRTEAAGDFLDSDGFMHNVDDAKFGQLHCRLTPLTLRFVFCLFLFYFNGTWCSLDGISTWMLFEVRAWIQVDWLSRWTKIKQTYYIFQFRWDHAHISIYTLKLSQFFLLHVTKLRSEK